MSKLVIAVEEMPLGDLNPGDIYSFHGPDYWDNLTGDIVAEQCWMRTDEPATPTESETVVYRLIPSKKKLAKQEVED